jgi:predicted nucleic acid-binding protein
MTYFDSLIVALAQEMEATVITKDLEIAKRVETEW